MSPEQPPQGPKPPKPPEYGARSSRVHRIAMIGYLWDTAKQERSRQILLQATAPHKRLERAGDDARETFDSGRIILQNLRAGLDINLEAEGEIEKTTLSQFLASFQKNAEVSLSVRGALVKHAKSFIKLALALSDELKSKGVLATFEQIKKPLTDQAFADNFKYNGVVQGLDDEVLALLPKSEDREHPPLYLGMTVFYTKKLPSSGGTGPDLGEGKIVMFFPPTGKIPVHANMVIPDQVIELEIKTEHGVTRSLFSTKEVSLMPPPASSKD